ncbi:hypothetical protein [Catellatospora sp. NPDC049609]|uniref:hypothetical protein n=1 Tax=Catellatospora sp. NPDC049609 TaxID=3155505 RepID=UPI00343FFDDB
MASQPQHRRELSPRPTADTGSRPTPHENPSTAQRPPLAAVVLTRAGRPPDDPATPAASGQARERLPASVLNGFADKIHLDDESGRHDHRQMGGSARRQRGRRQRH